jgi:RIO-like serine/threonine protein kinase
MKLKIEEKIGNGGQAEVYRATDELENQYAVKIFFR